MRKGNQPDFEGTRDTHDYSTDPKVPEPYKIVNRLHRYVLMSPTGPKKKLKVIYTCRAFSEMGCHREALIYLKARGN